MRGSLPRQRPQWWRGAWLRWRAFWAVLADLSFQPRPRRVLLLLLATASAGLIVDGWLHGWPWGLVSMFAVVGPWFGLLVFRARLAQEQRVAAGSLQHLTRQLPPGAASRPSFRKSLHSSAPATASLEEISQEVAQALSESERRWKARARLSADWYWETDEALRVVWVSEDLKSHVKLGLQPADLLGKRHDEVPFYLPPEGGWEAFNQRLAQRRSFREVEIEVQRPGRSSVWTSISGRARAGAEGEFLGYEGIGRDVTERRLSFKRLRDSERRFAMMAEMSPDWYWETDTEHRIQSFGARARALLGDLALEAIGRTRWDAYPDGALAEVWAAHREDLAARRPFHELHFRARVPGRGPVWMSASGEPRFDATGAFLGYHGLARDITLYKRAERMLMTRNAELERLVARRTAELEQNNRDLEAFSRQLAHELRTPIGHIVGLADLLRSKAWERLGQDEREWLSLQGRSARAMSLTVTALLELARSGSVPLEREPVDLSALAHEVTSELPASSRHGALQWQIQPGLVADCGLSLMRVVLLNLLGNAAKFTRDVPAPRVAFGMREEDGQAIFFVQDNGAGFDEARASTLFHPFVRLHEQGQFQGTGLGLSIVRRVIERHGGSVCAHGRPGEGARIEFTLAQPLPELRVANTGASERAPAVANGESPDGSHRSAA